MNAVDLNLLRVFDALLDEGSVTKAGARLGLSQSAVSHALGRLRSLLDDELFVRTGAGIRPTERAREIGPDVHAALRQLQAALSVKAFDPKTTERVFTIMSGSFSSAVLIPQLVAEMAVRAPHAQLIVAEGAPDILEQLDSRRIDFVVGSVETAPERVLSEVLLRETLVWTVRVGHPLTRGKVSLERLMKTPHVAIRRQRREAEGRVAPQLLTRASWENLGDFENEVREQGLTRKIGVTVPDAYAAMAVVRRSDMAALLPRRLAEVSVDAGFLAIIRPPYVSPTVEINTLCLRDRLGEPAQAWMHGLIREIAQRMENL